MSQGAYTILLPLATVLPLASARGADWLIQTAAALLPAGGGGRVIVLGVVEIPEHRSFSEGAVQVRLHRALLERVRALGQGPDVEVRTLVRVSRQAWQGILDAARNEPADLILFGWKGWSNAEHSLFGVTIDEVVRNAPCDIAVAKRFDPSQVRKVLVPVRGGPHAALALRLAAGFAERADASVTALHLETPSAGPGADTRTYPELKSLRELAAADQRVIWRTVEADNVAAAILREARQHQLVVMGAAAGQPDTPFLFGLIAERMMQSRPGGVVVVKTPIATATGATDWRWPRLPRVASPAAVSELVDRWFAENTFDSHEFEDIEELVRLKERRGLTISLGLPALNEAETVGNVIRVLRSELQERVPLLDELVLVDSNSVDATREIARELGVPVYVHQEVLPAHGAYRGKGEALWKSQHVLKGDIIAWVDTDIRNIHPRFVYGLLGPLLRDERIQYVKGFYKRPIRIGGTLQGTGGGRVTELTARPLLNLFYPELSGIIQPLAGEYAGRRSLLEQLPFFTGYGVEIGMLLDVLSMVGLSGIGQVDLQRRVHRNQPLRSLSQMAFTITQVVMSRLEQGHRVHLLQDLNRSMKLIQHDRERFRLEVRELEELERPPMNGIPEYALARRALAASNPFGR